ncbi:DEAD/DEAH box helicase [Euryarchaeota archaeon ex4484_178]|nr:MAG: DEAD/DEAH box helicase [Euryarchaeota archaeon ex4484_178]
MEFPYSLRDTQRDIIKDVKEVLENSSHLVFEAPTGSGKTIAVLYPVVRYALKNNKKIIYLVHTNSQEQQVIKEAKRLGVFAVALQGRANLCPLARERFQGGNAEELSLLCSRLKKDVINGKREACPYYSNYMESGEEILEFIKVVHTAEEVFKKAMELGVCPYEAIKDAIKEATLIVAPYIYFLYPFIRRNLIEKMGYALQDIILIVDEAHNLPEVAREMRSMELTIRSLELMESEALEYENPRILGHTIADIGEFLKESIYAMEKFLQEEEGLIPHYAFEEEISKFLGIGMNDFEELSRQLIYYGEMVREDKIKRRKLPRSHIYHAGSFLYLWKEAYSYEFIRLIRGGKTPSIEIYSMDPSLITDVIKGVHSSIHLSGTLALENYRNLTGLPEDTVMKRYPSPFPQENLKVLYVDDVTTRYGEVEKHIDNIASYLERIIKMGRNTAIFFPSYSLLSKIEERMKIDALVEKRGMRQYALFEMVERFRGEGGAILSVLGGRLYEGMNFPGEQLEIVVIVGVPYPKPTPRVKMLERYYESKFGNGWEYAFKIPALIKIRQAIGRLIRSEEDRGVAVILDKRAPLFRGEIPAKRAENLIKEIENFFKR